MSLAAFKRRIRAGQKVTVVSNIHPHLSGERTVEKVQTRNLLTRAQDNGVWSTPWPKVAQVRIEGNTLHFLDADPDKVAFSYTFHFDTERAQTLAPGTRVTLNDPDFGPLHGRVVVCLCKRHKWQQQVGQGGPGTECQCGHARPDYPRAADPCPWPVHVRWDGSDPDDPNESHENPDDLTVRPFGIEVVVYRDPDGDTELSFYADGKHVSPRDLGITVFDVDPGRHAPEEEEEWLEATKEDIDEASPAAGARIRELTGLDEEHTWNER